MKRCRLKIGCILSLATLLAILLTGCAEKKELPDTYVEGSDYQYLLKVNEDNCKRVQQEDEVVYLLHMGFVFYLDETAGVILPLCNRADCLHDRETDEELRQLCNAYIADGNVSHDEQIAYCNGFLYCIPWGTAVYGDIPLYRLSTDGTKKEVIYKFKDEAVVEWIVHRDMLYYRSYTHTIDESGKPVDQERMRTLSITDSSPEPKTIFESKDGLVISSVAICGAYGNYLHFYAFGRYEMMGLEPVPEGEHLYYNETLAYDIRSGEITEFEFPERPQYASLQITSYWQDKPLFAVYYGDRDSDALTTWYVCGLDGSNPVPVMEDVPQGYFLRGGGEYLYFTNTVAWKQEDYSFYKILDENLNEVDTFFPPDYLDVDLRIGYGDRMYYVFDLVQDHDGSTSYDFYKNYQYPDESLGWGVIVWDKSGIGAYNGATLEFDTIMR